MGKVIIFSAPSGSGKTTIVRRLLERYPQFEFSISATSRAPRGQERDGVDYYFLSHEEFMQAVAENRFVEWEEVYKGTCYASSATTPARCSSCRPRSRSCADGSKAAARTPRR